MRVPRTAYVLTSAGLVSATLLVTPVSALAAWKTDAAEAAAVARAAVLPTGPVPTAAAKGSAVVVDWRATTLDWETQVRGYRVDRTNEATGVTVPAGPGCAGVRTRTICIELDVPDGRWTYSVVALMGDNWRSAPGIGATTLVGIPMRELPAAPETGGNGTDPGSTPQPAEENKPAATPGPTGRPSATPTPTKEPDPAATPSPTEEPGPAATPGPTEKPTPTTNSDPSVAPHPAATSHPDVTGEPAKPEEAKPTRSSEPKGTPEPKSTSEPKPTKSAKAQSQPAKTPDPTDSAESHL